MYCSFKYNIFKEAHADSKAWGRLVMVKINYTSKRKSFNNQFFESELGYEEFVEAMMAAADAGELPKVLEHKEPEALTIDGIKQFSRKFKQDSGLDIEFKFTTCNHCDRLHCLMIVDGFPEWKTESVCS